MTNFIVRLLRAFLPKKYYIIPVDQILIVESHYQVTETEIKKEHFPDIVVDHAKKIVVSKLAKELADHKLIRIEQKTYDDKFLQMDVTDFKAIITIIKPTN